MFFELMSKIFFEKFRQATIQLPGHSLAKIFSFYRTLPFSELIKRASETTQKEFFISENEKYYLRSLGADERKDIADIKLVMFNSIFKY